MCAKVYVLSMRTCLVYGEPGTHQIFRNYLFPFSYLMPITDLGRKILLADVSYSISSSSTSCVSSHHTTTSWLSLPILCTMSAPCSPQATTYSVLCLYLLCTKWNPLIQCEWFWLSRKPSKSPGLAGGSHPVTFPLHLPLCARNRHLQKKRNFSLFCSQCRALKPDPCLTL